VDTTETNTINHLSLCSGYEGIGIGLRRVLPNLREIAYVEREGFPVANLVAKMESGELDPAPVFTDVKTFPYGKFRGCVDILSGGFPCQPFSAAGKREGVEDPRHLFPYIADGIRECEPRIVFLENVEGIISSKTADGESVLQYVLRELEGLGYRAEAGIFSASEVGAPHQRKRVFILAYSDSERRQRPINLLGDARQIGQGREDSSEDSVPTTNWPARPKEPQHDWEEPRVVVNATSKGLEGSRGSSLQGTHEGLTCTNRVTGQAEPRLGGATNGASSRVDRLRLLGNGVVPATAARAFSVLSNRIINN
jgi:DNA (cytosine-5)-methyltransferase 1